MCHLYFNAVVRNNIYRTIVGKWGSWLVFTSILGQVVGQLVGIYLTIVGQVGQLVYVYLTSGSSEAAG